MSTLNGITSVYAGRIQLSREIQSATLAGNFSGNVTISGKLGKVSVAGNIGAGVWMANGKHIRG